MDFKFLFINAYLNDSINESLFRVNVKEKIFDKYEITKSYNKLVTKQFYDANFECTKIRGTL
jgi:hypothetical protein